MKIWIASILLWLLPLQTFASTGDRLPVFQSCVTSCIEESCPARLSWDLQLFQWTCASNCDYTCQQKVTAERVRREEPLEQFHGKWPFKRLYGMQEPLSIFFSILNFYAHWRGLRYIRRRIPESYALRPYYVAWSLIGLNSWIWSSVFHARDFRITERADYFAAGASVMYGFFYAPIRIFHLERHKIITVLWGTLCALVFLAHISYLSFIKFDYGYNMRANVTVGALQHVLWTYFSLSHYHSGPSWIMWPAIIVTLLAAAMSLEVFDFPPVWDALDAHALWHASTPLLTSWWYAFLVRDSNLEAEREMKV